MTSTITKKNTVHLFGIFEQQRGNWGETYSDGEPRQTYRAVQLGTVEAATATGALRKYAKANDLAGYSHLSADDLTLKAEREEAQAKAELDLSCKRFFSGYTQLQFDELSAWTEEHYRRAEVTKRKLRELDELIEFTEYALRRSHNYDAELSYSVSVVNNALENLRSQRQPFIDAVRPHLVAYTECLAEQERVGLLSNDRWAPLDYELTSFDRAIAGSKSIR